MSAQDTRDPTPQAPQATIKPPRKPRAAPKNPAPAAEAGNARPAKAKTASAKPAKAKAAARPAAKPKKSPPAKAKQPATGAAAAFPAPPPIRPSAPILADAPAGNPARAGKGVEDAMSVRSMPLPDIERLSTNVAHFIEKGGKALAAWMAPIEAHPTVPTLSDEVADALKSIGHVAEYWLADPTRTVQAQSSLSHDFINLWAHTLRRLTGQEEKPVAPPEPGDKRFAGKDWEQSPFYDFLRQAYTLTSKWAVDLVEKAEHVDAHTRDKAAFYVRQLSSALAPSNFLLTNPELLRETFEQSGENLVRGADILAEDIEAGGGSLKIRQVDHSKFELGVNLATTPGKVVYRNDLIELIQYNPTTDEVYKRPLLIVPPWINKFYILDLNPEKSFIRWAVAQGLTVFVISWVNPDSRHRDKDFAAYMHEGVFAAMDAVKDATGEDHMTAIGYCVGGTLLSCTLAWMAEKGDTRIDSATLFTTQVDFRYPGDLRVFVDEAQIAATEEKMKDTGYLDGAKMATAFNMLRPNDLIWSYVVNNYIRGKAPMAFDLLAWNSDSTRMPAANHSYYLRNCYLNNNLTKGEMVLDGVRLDLGKVTIPIYDLASREDHIAPAKSVFIGAEYFGGPVRYVMAGSGHIAGVVNPADKPKYQYWTGPQPTGTFEDWVAQAKETPGSWWPDWIRWIAAQAPEKVKARVPGDGKLKPLGDAPGEYVRMKC
jgi:polyhydroxyalkanoate synthase